MEEKPPDTVAFVASEETDATSRFARGAFIPICGGRCTVRTYTAFPDITATHIRETDQVTDFAAIRAARGWSCLFSH